MQREKIYGMLYVIDTKIFNGNIITARSSDCLPLKYAITNEFNTPLVFDLFKDRITKAPRNRIFRFDIAPKPFDQCYCKCESDFRIYPRVGEYVQQAVRSASRRGLNCASWDGYRFQILSKAVLVDELEIRRQRMSYNNSR